MIVCGWPLTLNDPVRGVVVLLGCTVYEIELWPEPVGLETVIHSGMLVADHWQFCCVFTVTVKVPPPTGTVRDGGTSPYVHVGGAPCWLTVWLRPPIDNVAERAAVASLRETVYRAWPLPVPRPSVICSHRTSPLTLAVHSQPSCVSTRT